MTALYRLVELSSGSIRIDGVDISKVGLKQLRKGLAIIPQDTVSLASSDQDTALTDSAFYFSSFVKSYKSLNVSLC